MRRLAEVSLTCFLAFAYARAELPPDVQLMLDGLHNKVELQAQAAELLTSVEALYREGETLYESGRQESRRPAYTSEIRYSSRRLKVNRSGVQGAIRLTSVIGLPRPESFLPLWPGIFPQQPFE